MKTASVSAPDKVIIVCLEDHPKTIMLMRMAKKRAQEQGLKWRAVFVETPSHMKQTQDSPHERMLRLLTLAEQMGGETAHLEAETVEQGVATMLEKEADRVALVVVGSIEPEGRLGYLRVLPWMRIVRQASQYTQVEVLPLSGQNYSRGLRERLHLQSVHTLQLLYALGAVVLAYLGAFGLQQELPPALFRVNDQNVALLFMIACAFVAGRYGILPGLLASVASFVTVNYYFLPPYHSLKMNTVTDMLNMALFLSAALLISLFTSQTRGYAQQAAKRELSTSALFTLYRVAANAFSRQQALEQLQGKLAQMLGVDVAFFMPPMINPLHIELTYPTDLLLTAEDRRALDACWTEIKTTGLASPFNPGTSWRFEPMIAQSGEIGVLGVRPRGTTRLDAWFGRMLTAIADQTASVFEHIELERSMGETRLREEREKLRAMLLSSVSHDFKTPLAGIIGALSVYRSMNEKLTPQKRDALIEAAIEEAQRLDSFITNILDMTRLESGNITFRQDWHDVEAVIKNVVKRVRHRLKKHELVIHPYPLGIEVFMDPMMIEQVIQNVLDNACKYTPAGTRIEISYAIEDEKGFLLTIRDHGDGLPEEALRQVFDKYARLQKKDSKVAGTGLGLAIGKAILEAQKGWISAANHPGGGAVFTLCLPQWRKTKSQPRLENAEAAATPNAKGA